MSYLIIDKQYRIFHSDRLTGYLHTQCRRGNLSIVNLKTMKGLNLACSSLDAQETWSDIQEWLPEFRDEAA